MKDSILQFWDVVIHTRTLQQLMSTRLSDKHSSCGLLGSYQCKSVHSEKQPHKPPQKNHTHIEQIVISIQSALLVVLFSHVTNVLQM